MALKTVDVPKELEPTHAAVELTGSALREHGESVGTEGAIRDITERKRMEQRLVRQNGLLQAINQVFEKALACESEEAVAVVCLNVGEELTGSKFGFIGKLKEAGLFDTMAISNPGWDACKMPHSEAGKSIKGVPLRGIDRATMRDGKSRIVNDPASHADRVGVPEGHPPITCFLGVPLKQGDKTIGMIALANKEGGYDPADQEAVEALSVAFVEALERKRAEKSLRMSEQRYRQLLRAVTSYTYTVHLEDGVPVSTEHSPGCTATTGYPPERYDSDPTLWISMIHPDDREMVEQVVARVLAGDEVPAIEHRILHKDGTTRWVQNTLVQHRNAAGQLVRYDGLVEDITDRKQVGGELRNSEMKFRTIADYAYDMEIWHGPDGQLLWINPAVERHTGYSVEECMATVDDLPFPFVHKDDREVVAKTFRQAIKEKTSGNDLPFRVRCKDGTTKWMAVSWQPIYDDRAHNLGLRASVRDISETKKVEHQLRKLSRAVEHSSAAVVITDPQGRIEYVNPKFTTMTGYASQDVLGQTPRILNSGHHSAEFFKEMWDTILRGEEWHGELCNRRKDGHLQWENTSISPIRDDRGNITHFVAVKEDVTERKRTERALRLNESRLQALLQLNQMAEAPTPDITDFALEKAVELTESELGYLASMNEDETVLTVHSWSRAAMEQCAIVDKPLVYPVETTGLCGEAIRQRKPVITNDYAAPNPLKRGYPSGHVRISRHMDVPVFDGERIVAVAGVGNKDGEYDESDVRQLTLLMQGMWRLLQRKKSEEALRVSERKLRTMTASLGEGLIVQDDTGQLIFMNPEAERLLGWKESELLGKEVHTIIHANHGETGTPGEQDCMMQKVVRTGDAYRADTEVFAHRDGTKFPVSVVATPITEHDSIVGSITAFRDITQRKTTEETLRHKEEELRQSQKLETVGELAGGIAHEFNNLLQAIGGYTKYAMEGLPPGGQRYQDLQQVERAAGRAATLIRQLLGFGRRETLKPQDLCLNKVVTGVLKMLRPVIGEHIEVKTVFDNKVGTVHADPTLIEQVLMNLCINARDAMPSGGALTVETRDLVLSDAYCETHVDIKPGRHVQITVSDTGYGMAPEVVEHIFDPFYTTKEVGEGTGLGLAVVYGVVKQHGGGIHVYSEPGLGTNFKLFLPTVEKAVCSDNEEGPETVPGGTETILVAEDEPLVRDLAVRILTDAGYSVLPVSDGEEALRVFQTNANTVSLALLDVVMPKMTGRMVYQGIKMLKPEAKVLFCSGYDTDTNCGGFIANEGLQCVKKPFDSKELLRSVRETLDGEPTCQTLQTTS